MLSMRCSLGESGLLRKVGEKGIEDVRFVFACCSEHELTGRSDGAPTRFFGSLV